MISTPMTEPLGRERPTVSRQPAGHPRPAARVRRRDIIHDTVTSRPWIGPGTAALGLLTFLGAALSVYGGANGTRASAATVDVRRNVLADARYDAVRDETRPARRDVVGMEIQPLRIYGKVDVDLRPALEAAGIPDAQVDQYVKIISREVSPDTVGPGDHFDLVLQQRLGHDGQPEIGSIMYAGLYRTDGVNVRLAEWRRGSKLSWFDADEVGQTHQAIQRPVPGVVSSNYGPRMHPILGYTRMHKGMDFRAGYGTPILAVQTGYVEIAGWNAGGYGNRVELLHGGGISTTYSHMSGIAVRPGQLVQQGQVIGYVGATGLATGPHLHYELHRYGQAIDPSSVQFTATSQLAGNDLVGYRTRLGQMLSLPFGRSPERPWMS
jgi:murein DD-endopeptidase MepM/ murein hydrolase activator NlpD